MQEMLRNSARADTLSSPGSFKHKAWSLLRTVLVVCTDGREVNSVWKRIVDDYVKLASSRREVGACERCVPLIM